MHQIVRSAILKNLRARLAASFIRHFYDLCGDLQDDGLLNEYTERCFIIGQKIDIIRGSGQVPALALGITEDFGLRIQYNDGREEVLSAGEVRIRPHSKLK